MVSPTKKEKTLIGLGVCFFLVLKKMAKVKVLTSLQHQKKDTQKIKQPPQVLLQIDILTKLQRLTVARKCFAICVVKESAARNGCYVLR